jgi:hypothetical protein
MAGYWEMPVQLLCQGEILRGWIGPEATRDIPRWHFLALRGSGRPKNVEKHRNLTLDA